MPTAAVLLRGVNVGGHKLSMSDLRADLEAAGYRNVRTYIQSGNVVLDHAGASGTQLARTLEARISALAGYSVPVTVRTAAQLRSVVERNPFDDADPTKLVVWFLDDKLPADALAPLDEVSFAPEQYALSGREIYLSLPNGQGRGLLPAALGKLKAPELATATARNWRTVLTLLEMASAK